jgi:hypothetical protein
MSRGFEAKAKSHSSFVQGRLEQHKIILSARSIASWFAYDASEQRGQLLATSPSDGPPTIDTLRIN